MKAHKQSAHPSVDEVLQELEGTAPASASAHEQDVYGQYSWEREVERSWEAIVETEGQLRFIGSSDNRFEYRSSVSKDAHIKRALLRSMVIVLDATEGMREIDFKPDRLTCATQVLEEFLSSFLLQNPLAQIAVVVMADSAAEVLLPVSSADSSSPVRMPAGGADSCYFSSNVEELAAVLKARKRSRSLPTANAPSLKNGLDRARALLASVPPYCTREVLVVYGSIRTCDVGNIEETLDELTKIRARCSVVSLAPEVRILKALSTRSGGSFGVALQRDHLRTLLLAHTQPPPWLEGLQPCLIRVGFPPFKESSTASLCSCHKAPRFKAYTCPLCSAKVCGVPGRCQCCSLHLLSPADVSRSFHSLCLPQSFEVIKDFPPGSTCCACRQTLSAASKCPECQNTFCAECDWFCHEQLRQCPFCVMEDITQIEAG